MATATVEQHPPRGWERVKLDSTPVSSAILVLGAGALTLVLLGPIIVLGLNGYTPVDSLIEGYKSGAMRGVGLTSIVIGAISIVWGALKFRSMATKVSREQAIAGAVLGIQAAVLGVALLWFIGGDVHKFAINYLDFAVIGPQMGHFVNGAKNTVVLAFTSELLGVVLGLVLAVFAISKRSVVRAPARAYINFFRGTPLVWQLIFIGIGIPIGLGIDISTYEAAIIALSLNMGAYAAEVFRAGIQSIERGQLEAARGLGMSYMQAMRYAVIPQAIRRVIPPLMNEFVILIKDTSLVIVLGLTSDQRDIMSVAHQAVSNSFNASFYIMAALGYLAVSLPLIRVVNVLEKKLRSGLVGVGA
jgi:His/Glu/Gln/Arg/opine family amino acid ABC transporter permease subunit